MAILAQNYQCTIEGYQTSAASNGGTVYFRAYPNQHPGRTVCDWVGRYKCCEVWYENEQISQAWASPYVFDTNLVRHSGGGYYVKATGHQYAYEFYTYADWNTNTEWTLTRFVNIDRGNSRQASKTVAFRLQDRGVAKGQSKGNWWGGDTDGTIIGYVTVYTEKIADVSNISFKVTVDGATVRDRYIHIRASFTNPENYYTGNISSFSDSITGSFSRDIAITNSMFNTDKSYTFSIKGKDNNVYYTKTISVHIDPSGVGAWYKRPNGSVKEVTDVYYKDSNGNIRNVTEGWYKKNGQTIVRTTK